MSGGKGPGCCSLVLCGLTTSPARACPPGLGAAVLRGQVGSLTLWNGSQGPRLLLDLCLGHSVL